MTDNIETENGYRLRYDRVGTGPSVLLIHGIPTSRHLWRHVAATLAASGREVIAVDMLGYGDSDKPVDVDLGIAAQAKLLSAAMTKVGWDGGCVVGHDIGGGVAQLMALDDPTRIRKMILVDSIVYDSFPEPGIARLKDPAWDAILGAEDFDLSKGLAKGFARGLFRSDRAVPELIAAYEKPFHGRGGRLAYLRAARALRTEELSSRMNEVENLRIPTLIVWGGKDEFQPLSYGRRLAAKMPDARMEVIDEAGHFLPEDQPERLAELIAEFTTSEIEGERA